MLGVCGVRVGAFFVRGFYCRRGIAEIIGTNFCLFKLAVSDVIRIEPAFRLVKRLPRVRGLRVVLTHFFGVRYRFVVKSDGKQFVYFVDFVFYAFFAKAVFADFAVSLFRLLVGEGNRAVVLRLLFPRTLFTADIEGAIGKFKFVFNPHRSKVIQPFDRKILVARNILQSVFDAVEFAVCKANSRVFYLFVCNHRVHVELFEAVVYVYHKRLFVRFEFRGELFRAHNRNVRVDFRVDNVEYRRSAVRAGKTVSVACHRCAAIRTFHFHVCHNSLLQRKIRPQRANFFLFCRFSGVNRVNRVVRGGADFGKSGFLGGDPVVKFAV